MLQDLNGARVIETGNWNEHPCRRASSFIRSTGETVVYTRQAPSRVAVVGGRRRGGYSTRAELFFNDSLVRSGTGVLRRYFD